MNIELAVEWIGYELEKMDAGMGEHVFNEWVITEKTASGWKILKYNGDRKEEFLETFHSDIAALHDTLDPATSLAGDFAFSHEGYGSGFDAYICVGNHCFILFNNTKKNTDEITKSPKWMQAQIYFAALAERFISDQMH